MSKSTKEKKPYLITIIITIFVILFFVKVYMSLKPGLDIFAEPSDELIYPGEKHFKNIRQLTFSGENAEAYFSSDGKKLIFQGHDGENLCDQIYILDLVNGHVQLISTGDGVTTCSFFEYPSDGKIVYASTHHYGKECPSPPDFSRGYIWKLHPEFDIFRANPNGSELIQLTNAPGYDAEATYDFSGSGRIVYTSLESGDLEVWTMNSDGSDKKQLTNKLGYDGGPFFSHDGKKIVWRAYYPETEAEIADYMHLLEISAIRPMALQIRVMDADGSNKIQVTDNTAANFGPFFFLNDERIIFCSNMGSESGREFDLWAINIDGTNLEQITFYQGFDGFPIFSPDGKYFVFCSNRNNAKKGDTNIFICEWMD